ncbi:MAG: DUF2065 domain-containing protein [Gammaproteobacteria bacterium]
MIDIWHVILIAVCITIILEGMMLFISPTYTKKAILYFSELSNKSLRIIGLICMILGLGLFLSII